MISPDVHVHHGFQLVPPQIVVTLDVADALNLLAVLGFAETDPHVLHTADQRRFSEELRLELQPAIEEAEAAIHTTEPTG